VIPGYIQTEEFLVEETYIKTTDKYTEIKIRRRGKNDSYIYNEEIKKRKNNENIERKRQITAREYISLLAQRDDTRKQIAKKRQCFLWQTS
jgi:hypothetical protein